MANRKSAQFAVRTHLKAGNCDYEIVGIGVPDANGEIQPQVGCMQICYTADATTNELVPNSFCGIAEQLTP